MNVEWKAHEDGPGATAIVEAPAQQKLFLDVDHVWSRIDPDFEWWTWAVFSADASGDQDDVASGSTYSGLDDAKRYAEAVARTWLETPK